MGIIGAILGVIVFLFALAWTQGLFGDATSKLDEGRTFELVNRLRANVKEAYFQESTYGTNANLVPTLTAMGKVPGSARGATAGTIVSPYGGGIGILGNGRRFGMTIEDLSDEACVNLGSRFAGGSSAEFGVVNITVGTAAVTTVFAGAPISRTLANMVAACTNGTNTNNLTITFR